MIKLLLAAALLCAVFPLGACASIPNTTESEALTIGAIASEAATAQRCPLSLLEVTVLIGARQAFDLSAGPRLTDAQRARVEMARIETDQACGLLASSAVPAPESS